MTVLVERVKWQTWLRATGCEVAADDDLVERVKWLLLVDLVESDRVWGGC